MSKKGIRVRYTELMTLLSPCELKKFREMRNASHAFEFLTRNWSLGELCILRI